MSKAIQVTRKKKLSPSDGIRIQILVSSFLMDRRLTQGELECLAYLSYGPALLSAFCKDMADKGVYSSAQTVRNTIDDLEEKGLVLKEGRSRKTISLVPELTIHTQNPVLLNYQFLCYEPG